GRDDEAVVKLPQRAQIRKRGKVVNAVPIGWKLFQRTMCIWNPSNGRRWVYNGLLLKGKRPRRGADRDLRQLGFNHAVRFERFRFNGYGVHIGRELGKGEASGALHPRLYHRDRKSTRLNSS